MLSGGHLQIGIDFQPWGSLLRPSASCPVWNRSAPFGAPDSRHSIPTTLAHPTRPGTATDPHRILAVDNNVIYGEDTVCLRRGWGVAAGTAWTVLLAAADTSSGGPKCPSSRVLHGLGAWAKPGARRQTQEGVAGWPDFAEELGLIEPYLSAIRLGCLGRQAGFGGVAETRESGNRREPGYRWAADPSA
jgi:hypothetical protein